MRKLISNLLNNLGGIKMIRMTITNIIYKNPFDEKIENELEFDNEGNLLNHKNYLDYTSKHVDELRFDNYEEARKFFNETYDNLMDDFKHWIEEDENGRIEFVTWDRCEEFNMDLNIIFDKVL